MYIPFTSWLPDNQTTDQGILTDVYNCIPTVRGYASTPGLSIANSAALASDCKGVSTETTLSNVKVTFAGTSTKLYSRASTSSWTDVTRGSGDYSLGSTDKWRFVTQGNVTIAVAGRTVAAQKYAHATDTDFADVAAMPKANLVEAIGRHIIVANYNISSDIIDGWGCSKIDDYTDWTPSVDNQCVFGRLVDTPGPITGLKRLSDYVIFYKQNSMYLCRYVGVPDAFIFSLVSDNVGAVSQEAIVRIGRTHYFVGTDNIYSFDSATLQPIGDHIKDWFNERCNNEYRNQIVSTVDQARSIIYWFFPAGGSTTPTEYVAYNFVNGKWGRGEMAVQAAFEFSASPYTYNGLDSAFTTYAAYTTATYAELKYSGNTTLPAVISTDKIVYTITSSSGLSYITTADVGTDGVLSMIRRVRPRFYKNPDAANWYGFWREHMSDNKSEYSYVSSLSDGKFDYMKTARWHSGNIVFTGPTEIVGLDWDLVQQGKE